MSVVLKPPSYLTLSKIKTYSLAENFQKMALGSVSSPVADKFRADLPRKMVEPPWSSNETYEVGELVSIDLSIYKGVWERHRCVHILQAILASSTKPMTFSLFDSLTFCKYKIKFHSIHFYRAQYFHFTCMMLFTCMLLPLMNSSKKEATKETDPEYLKLPKIKHLRVRPHLNRYFVF